MKTRGFVLSCAIAAALCLSTTSALGKTAGCPCSPCKCSPCTCGGSGKSGGGKHHGKEHGHDHDSSFGVGGTVDLSGVGHRNAEPDPFGAGGGEKPVAHTEEKKTTTKKTPKGPEPISFDKIELTGTQAKAADEDESQPPSGGIGSSTVGDNQGGTDESPPPKTKEKKTKHKKWPKPIQDWYDKKDAADKADWWERAAESAYRRALQEFFDKSPHYKELSDQVQAAFDKAKASGWKNQQDIDAREAALKEYNNLRAALEKDFQATPDGKEKFQAVAGAEKNAAKAHDAEKEAGKNIDQATKDNVLEVEKAKQEKAEKENAHPR